jgi:hypothetical protein
MPAKKLPAKKAAAKKAAAAPSAAKKAAPGKTASAKKVAAQRAMGTKVVAKKRGRTAAQQASTPASEFRRNVPLAGFADGATTLLQVARAADKLAQQLHKMYAAGVKLEAPIARNTAMVVTSDAKVAGKFELQEKRGRAAGKNAPAKKAAGKNAGAPSAEAGGAATQAPAAPAKKSPVKRVAGKTAAAKKAPAKKAAPPAEPSAPAAEMPKETDLLSPANAWPETPPSTGSLT